MSSDVLTAIVLAGLIAYVVYIGIIVNRHRS